MKSKEIYPSTNVIIRPPSNLKNDEKELFAHASVENETIRATKVVEFESVFVWDRIFFSYFGFRQDIADLYYIWLPPVDYKYIHLFDLKSKIKFLLKRHFFTKQKKIAEAYWIEDNWVVGGYFHWVADGLTRIIAVNEIDKDAVFILSEKAQEVSFITESLSKLGINVVFLDTSFTYKITKFNLVEPIAHTGTYNKEIIRLVRKKIVNSIVKKMRTQIEKYI